MKLRINLKIFLIVTGCTAVVAAVISYFWGVSFWLVFVICFMAAWLNSLLLEFEDNLPGGFLNPTEEQTGADTKQK